MIRRDRRGFLRRNLAERADFAESRRFTPKLANGHSVNIVPTYDVLM